ncbi:MAG: hypothetical protein CVT47_03390 [Thermoplasmata archaeon HGW-Thermoplasmata-2]|nr:MAG: hypothetical protein CVT47_03390 [Thermoplasmata archaeon HGW-Thermoplasmata-2]
MIMTEIDESKKGKISPRAKAVLLIICLVAIGIILGLIVSNSMIIDVNEFLSRMKQRTPNADVRPLAGMDIVLPVLGVIVVFISMCLMVGLIGLHTWLFVKTKSKYVLSLLVFLVPLLIKSIFYVGALRGLFISAALPGSPAYTALRFSGMGLGNVLVICAVFESLAMGALLYLSME